ncbi:MAG: LIC_10091 family protein [Gemmatimonadaceae bacterium]
MNGLSHLRRHASLWGGGASLAFAAIAFAATGAFQNRPAAIVPLPERLSDSVFWAMVTEASEPDGYFRSDNLVSNELTFQHVIPELLELIQPDGVYLGVGPDQNFTYIAALRPRMAFIVDIRRGAMLQHLMYKGLIELSRDRADFLATLFSRARPPGLDSTTSVDSLMSAFDAVAPDSALFLRNFRVLIEHLTAAHRFSLTPDDIAGIEYVHGAFFVDGPALTYSFGRGTSGWRIGRAMPSYGELMIETDGAGVQRGYLANEMNFAALRAMHQRNLIVPIIGDFAGEKAVRAVGTYLKRHGATVSAIYTSNVEQYLFQGPDAWRKYYENVATLPLNDKSTFLRAVFNYGGYNMQTGVRRTRSITMLCSIEELLSAFRDGRIQGYWDVINMSRAPGVPATR